jgi:hypothetical protein
MLWTTDTELSRPMSRGEAVMPSSWGCRLYAGSRNWAGWPC